MNVASQKRYAQAVFLANAIVFSAICVGSRILGMFELRVLVESFAACYLVLLTSWCCLRTPMESRQLLGALLCGTLVILFCRYAIGDQFSRWLENALWYIPTTLAMCAPLRLIGHRIRSDSVERVTLAQRFSIRSLMLVTAIIAGGFPLIKTLAWAREIRQFAQYGWLFDSLALSIPVAVICISVLHATLAHRLFQLVGLLTAAPFIGILIGYVYGWSYYGTLVRLTATVAILTAILACWLKKAGFQWRFRPEQTSEF